MLVRRHRPVWEEFQEYRIVLEILFVNPITLYQFPFVSVFSAFLGLPTPTMPLVEWKPLLVVEEDVAEGI